MSLIFYIIAFVLHIVHSSVTPNATICIMTRDNVCLSTDVYYPQNGVKQPWTTIYSATPYGKDLTNPTQWITDDNGVGYVVLSQDFRGKGGSNGSYSFWRTAGNDTLDTIQWMLAQKWSNGYMTVEGGSALALNQYADICGVTQAIWNGEGMSAFNKYNDLMNHVLFGYLVVGDSLFRNTVFQNGAYRQCLMSGWLTSIGEPQMIQQLKKHESFSEWWYSLDGNWTNWDQNGAYSDEPQWEMLNFTILHHAGWYDIFGSNQIKTALGINTTAQSNAKGNQILIIEPGGHCEGGEVLWNNSSYGTQQGTYYSHILAKAVVESKQKNKIFNVHEYVPFNVLFYMLGPGAVSIESKGNYWVEAEGLPSYESKSFYLSNGELLTITPVTNAMNLTYTYDPMNPVKTHGGNNLICQPCGPWNQNSVEQNRNDILHFTADTLVSDIYIVGQIIVELYVSSDCLDTDFTAKLIDIYPDGDVHLLVQDGILRMRWRESEYQTEPVWMETDKIYKISIDIGYMSYIFNRGHQISLSISSSNNERFSVNYNSGHELIYGDTDWKIANNTVYFGGVYGSKLILPTVNGDWIMNRKVRL